LLTRTLNHRELDDFHDVDHELAGVNAGLDGGKDTQQLAVPEASTGTKVFCETSNLEPSVLSVTQTNTLSVFLVLFES
jgi:hypothetical protein